METRFSAEQLANPNIKVANDILRSCVHCGFCTATCPTYTLLGDELDSPRGRIYQIKDMLESGAAASKTLVKHVDRCLSCLSCMTTCPSGVHYMHLVDHARAHIEETHTRPLPERMLRALLAVVVPNPAVFRLALIGAWFARPFKALMPGRLKGMIAMAPKRLSGPSAVDRPQTFPAQAPQKKRVALMTGCAQQVLRTSINESTVRLLARLGCEVVIPDGQGCCGALVHHMGREDDAFDAAKKNIVAWEKVLDNGGLDAIVINASGCGTTVKDYGFMLRTDPDWAERAARIAALAKDVTEVLADLDVTPTGDTTLPTITYHSACSMQHGQKITDLPKQLLKAAGFPLSREPKEAHICCGSAGTYNLLQPDIADRLQAQKVANLKATGGDVIAAGNIGCLVQIASTAGMPVVHTVELLDWATGGPKPDELS